MLLRMLAIVLALAYLPAIAAEPPADLRDAAAWYQAARAEAARIPDPEQRNLLGQLAAASQEVTEDEAVKQVDALRAKYRGRPGVQDWQLSREAARQYDTLGYYRRAAEALDQAEREASNLEMIKDESMSQIDSDRRSLISRAAEQDAKFVEELADKIKDPTLRSGALSSLAYRLAESDIKDAERVLAKVGGERGNLALIDILLCRSSNISRAAEQDAKFVEELADKIKDPTLRSGALSSLAYRLAESDIKDAERVLAKVGGERGNLALIDILLCRSSKTQKAPHVKRGIELLLRNVFTMSDADLARCFGRVQSVVKEIVATCDAQQVTLLTELLEQTPRESHRHFHAINCLIDLRVAQGRIDDALKLADSNGDAFRQKIRRRTISLALISAGRLADAESVSDETGRELAIEYLRAKKPREALAAARRIDDIRIAYPHVVAALALLPADDRDTAEQALNDLVYDDVRAHALAAWGVKVSDQREPERARALVARAEKLLPQIKDPVQQRSAGLAVGQAYILVGAEREGDALLKKFGTSFHSLQLRLTAADQRLQAKDQAGFEREMAQALLILEAETLLSFGENTANEEFSPEHWQRPRPRHPQLREGFGGPPAPPGFAPWTPARPAPAAPVAPEQLALNAHDDAVIRFQFFVQASRLYRKAGDGKQARKLGAAAIASYSKIGGSFERWETFAETFMNEQTPERLQELAELAQDAKNPADRTVLLTLGGALAKHLNDQPK
ncbi:hypothetical protein [Anatilimnocola floriformis]|uniref:hypothetical protein n=1 Tax=Anatilimnocola floriformis TaxID=2948575 RepID=UPI0020C4476C|nr:hypothetical protein [Anatilimnocola floriformis]